MLPLVSAAVVIFVYMLFVFVIAQLKKDTTIVDVAWSLGFIVIALLTLIKSNTYYARQILVTTLITLWGLRLSYYIYLRNKGRGEDPRYKAWRAAWGNYFLVRSFFQIFMFQGLIILIVVYPAIAINSSDNPELNLLDALGVFIWIFGYMFETIGDYQLKQFLSNSANKGKVMDQGLWRYTRHPNYFGEATMWWGIFLIALSVPRGLSTIISPITITYLLRFVSGVPMTEKLLAQTPGYAEYQQRVSPMLPWFRKKK